MGFIPDCVQTINVPEISAEAIEAFSSYKAVLPCHSATFVHKSLNQPDAIFFRKRPEGSDSDEIYHVSSTDDLDPTRITYLTGKGKGNTISDFIPMDFDEDDQGDKREGGGLCTIDANGEEFFQIFRLLPVEGGVGEASHTLEAWTPPGSLARSMRLSNDGSKMLYTCNARNGKDMDLYLRYLKNRPDNEPVGGEMTLELSGQWFVYDWNVDDSKVLLSNTISSSDNKLYILDIKTLELEPIILPNRNDDGIARKAFGRFSKTEANVLYLNTNWMSEYHSVIIYNYETKSIRPITTLGLADSILPIEWPCVGVASETKLVISANVDGYDELHVMDLATDKIAKVPIARSVAGQINSLSISPNNPNLAVLVLESVSSPGIIYQLNLDTLALTPYKTTESSKPNHPVSIPKLIRYKSFDGLAVPAFVYLPSTHNAVELDTFTPDEKLPVIIYMHGGPTSQHVPAYNPRLYLQYLIHTLDVCIIAPNVRGSTGYGLAYMEADDGPKREDSVKDIGALLDYISTSMPYLDTSRICAMGRSYGGYMTLACLTHYSDRLKCGVETCGISNWVTFLETTAVHRRDNRRAEYGDERDPAMREILLKISPITNADKISIPCFMSHGRNDTRVPFSEFEQMKAILQKNNGEDSVWAFMADNEGHIYRQKPVNDAQVVCMAEFMKHFL